MSVIVSEKDDRPQEERPPAAISKDATLGNGMPLGRRIGCAIPLVASRHNCRDLTQCDYLSMIQVYEMVQIKVK